MTDKPMIFSAPMVRALLDGRKTQTRRVLKPQPEECSPSLWPGCCRPRYAPGDRLWVRETWENGNLPGEAPMLHYRADTPDLVVRWRSPIHMPRWASRLTLHVTDVRVQRVQEISLADMDREGWPGVLENKRWTPAEWFIDTWNAINAKRGNAWSANPWVVALTFTVERANIDNAKGAE